MKTRKLIAASLLAALSGVALADGGTYNADPFTSSLTRAQVQNQVIQARAAGQLTPAGEGAPIVTPNTRSTLRRADLRAEVLQARASGQLIAAGEGPEFDTPYGAPSVSTLARADVKAQVLQARATVQLIPAGEGPDANDFAQAGTPAHPVRTATNWFRAHTGSGN